MPHDLQASLAAYRPYNEQEQHDLPLLLAALKQPDSFTRQNETAHFTASAWVMIFFKSTAVSWEIPSFSCRRTRCWRHSHTVR